jgi:hypothetical protein
MATLIRFDRDFAFPTKRTRVDVVGTDRPSAGFFEADDAIAFMLWLLPRDMIPKRLDALIDGTDTTGALSHEVREKADADLTLELLAIEASPRELGLGRQRSRPAVRV